MSPPRQVILNSISMSHNSSRSGLRTFLLSSALASQVTIPVSVSDGGAVLHSEKTSAGGIRRKWDALLNETRSDLSSLPDVISSLTSPDESQAKFSRLNSSVDWVQRDADGERQWAYSNEYIWQGLKREKRMVTLAEGSEPKTNQFFIAQKVLSIDPTSSTAILPSLAIATAANESDTSLLIAQLAHTLKRLHESGTDAAEVALETMAPNWPIPSSSQSLRHMAQQTLLERFKALKAECDSWILPPMRTSRSQSAIPQSDLATIWKSLKKCDYGSKAEKLQLLKAMTKCLRKIAKVVGRRIGPIPAAVEHCVDEIFQKMPPVIDTFRCKLLRSFFLKSRIQIAGLEFTRSDLEKIKRLRVLRDQIFQPLDENLSDKFLGVHFTTRQALEVVSYLVQQMWEEEHKALLRDWYESVNTLLSRSDDEGLMIWIVNTLAEVGSERSLHCLYTLFCQAQNATLVVHKDLHNFLIYQSTEQETPTKLVQIHTPKGCGCRAIHLVNAHGKALPPGEALKTTLQEGFGLSLRPDVHSMESSGYLE